MAKKKAAPKVAGRGKKLCDGCGEVIASATKTCKLCGHVHQKADSTTSTKTTSTSTGGSKFDKALATISLLKEFIETSGGLDAAEATIKEVEQLTKECGGTKALLKALASVDAM